MNILFLCCTYTIGGVNMVTQALTERFSKDGHIVGVFTFDGTNRGMELRYDKMVKLYSGRNTRFGLGNIRQIRRAIQDNETDVVVNNWGMRPWYILQVKLASIGLKRKPQIISVYHSDPCVNGALMGVEQQIDSCHSAQKQWILHRKKQLIHLLSAINFRVSYAWSRAFLLLSPSFVKRFGEYMGIKDLSKIRVQTNPITTKPLIKNGHKINEILYVGQLRERLKRVSRLMETWKELEPNHPDWKFTILGDGPEADNIRQQIEQYQLKNVSLEGFKDPVPYYQRAKLLLLTSESEGFGLVIIEGMQSGVVPVIYGSYPAVFDIIEDGNNGVIIPYREGGYDAVEAAEIIETLMRDNNKLHKISENAQLSSEKFSMDTIAGQWYRLFEELAYGE